MPKYREDIKGNVKETIKEFLDSLNGEITHEDAAFFFGTKEEIRETDSYREYSDYLTDAEMIKAAKKISLKRNPTTKFYTVKFKGPIKAAVSQAALRNITFISPYTIRDYDTGKYGTEGKVPVEQEFALKKWLKTGDVEITDMKTNPRKKSRSRYKHKRIKSSRAFDARSIRTISRGGKKIRVGCPVGKYSQKKKRCKVGMRAQAILTPKKNPKETIYFILGKKGIQSGLYNEDRNSLTDQKEDATHFHDKISANIVKRNLELQFNGWKWRVVPITFFQH